MTRVRHVDSNDLDVVPSGRMDRFIEHGTKGEPGYYKYHPATAGGYGDDYSKHHPGNRLPGEAMPRTVHDLLPGDTFGDYMATRPNLSDRGVSEAPVRYNGMGKSRPTDRPYMIFKAPGFTWHVLKSYQNDDTKPGARWFLATIGPGTFGSFELGDGYVADVVNYGTLTYKDPVLGDYNPPGHIAGGSIMDQMFGREAAFEEHGSKTLADGTPNPRYAEYHPDAGHGVSEPASGSRVHVGNAAAVLQGFLDGRPMRTSSAPVPGGRRISAEQGPDGLDLYSYRTVVARRLSDGRVAITTRRYSVTTSKMLNRLRGMLGQPTGETIIVRAAVPGRWGGYGPAWHETGWEDVPFVVYANDGRMAEADWDDDLEAEFVLEEQRIREAAFAEHADHGDLPRSCFAYAPGDNPSEWKLPYKNADGSINAEHLGMAAAAVSSGGFRGNRVDIPESAMASVKAKLRQAYRRIDSDPPEHLRESEEERLIEVAADAKPEVITFVESGIAPVTYGESAFTTLREAGAVFDDAKREVWITPIRPGWGNQRDGFYYTEAALKQAVTDGLFNGRKMYANHPRRSDEKDLPERDVRDWVATVKETVWDDRRSQPRARLRVYDEAAYKRFKDAPDEIAFSILGGGVARPGKVGNREARIVEALKNIRSIDWVTEAGAGGAIDFAESAHEEFEMELENLTAEQLKDGNPTLYAALTGLREAEGDAPPAPPEGFVAKADFEAVQAENAALKAAQADRDAKDAEAAAKDEAAKVVESTLGTSTLPKAAKDFITAHFAEAAVGENFLFPDKESLKDAVKREMDAMSRVTASTRGSSVKGLGTPPPDAEGNGTKTVSVAESVTGRIQDKMDTVPMPSKAKASGGVEALSESGQSIEERIASRV